MQLQILYLLSFLLAFAYAFYLVFFKKTNKYTQQQLPEQDKVSNSRQFKLPSLAQLKIQLVTNEYNKQSSSPQVLKIQSQSLKVDSNITKSNQKETQSKIIEPMDFNYFNIVQKYVQEQKDSNAKPGNNLNQIKQLNSYFQSQSELIDAYEPNILIDRENKKQSRKEKERKKMQALKDHYKKIIAQLQQKLQAVCIRNNQSFDGGVANETITFTQESMLSEQNNEEVQGVKMKFDEVCNLQQQLRFQEQLLTNLLEEDQKLKQKLTIIQTQNNNFKKSRISQDKNVTEIDKLENTNQQRQSTNFDFLFSRIPKTQEKRAQHSPIKNLYTSQIVYNHQMPASTLYSRAEVNPATFSAISMLSIIQGAISIGLLSQCRFLNQISKKYTINEIKKSIKRRIVDSELIYTNVQNAENQKTFSADLKKHQNLLILIKLINGKTIASFIQTEIFFAQEMYEQEKEGHIILIDLGKRKKLQSFGRCLFEDQCLIWGSRQFVLKESIPITASSQQTGSLVTTKLQAIQLFGTQNLYESTVEFLYIYALTPSAQE